MISSPQDSEPAYARRCLAETQAVPTLPSGPLSNSCPRIPEFSRRRVWLPRRVVAGLPASSRREGISAEWQVTPVQVRAVDGNAVPLEWQCSYKLPSGTTRVVRAQRAVWRGRSRGWPHAPLAICSCTVCVLVYRIPCSLLPHVSDSSSAAGRQCHRAGGARQAGGAAVVVVPRRSPSSRLTLGRYIHR